jgi:hypothetical protein
LWDIFSFSFINRLTNLEDCPQQPQGTHLANTGFILTKSVGASVPGGGNSVSTTINTPIPTATSVIVDAITMTNYAAAKWLVTIIDPFAVDIQTYEVVGHYKFGTAEPSWTRYASVGARVNHAPFLYYDSMTQTLQLKITNNESHTINVSIARFEVVA